MNRKITLIQEEQIKKIFEWGYGFSIYQGVLVVWDKDLDKRILLVVDSIPSYDRDGLVAIQERKAAIFFLWQDSAPGDYYNSGKWSFNCPCGDVFNTFGSYTISSIDGQIEQIA